MRGRTAALYVATTTLIAGSLGPYGVGRLADAFGSLRPALACLYLPPPAALLFFLAAVRALPDAHSRRGAPLKAL
jgi:hypothetical protein